MDYNVNEMLEVEIAQSLEDLAALPKDTDEYRKAVENLNALYRIRANEEERSSKEKQAKSEKRFKFARLGVDVAGILMPMMFYAYHLKEGYRFEKDHIVTSPTFKSLIRNFRPTKL